MRNLPKFGVRGVEPMPAGVPLTEREAEGLRTLLRFLKSDCRHSYKVIASAIGVDVQLLYDANARRGLADSDLLSRLQNYCKERSIKYPFADRELSSSADWVIDWLQIDRKIIDDSGAKFRGNYLLFSFARDDRIAVTWFRLFDRNRRFPVPYFTAWRVDADGNKSKTHGFYYHVDGSLFLVGHSVHTSFVRLITLIPAPLGQPHRDRVGVISGASRGEMLFVTACYFKWLGDPKSREHPSVVGEYDCRAVADRFPEVYSVLSQRSDIRLSARRPSA